MSATSELNAIREELNGLAIRVHEVEVRLGYNGSPPLLTLDASVMTDVRRITQDIFPGKFELVSEQDPEYPDDRYLVVEVEATGKASEIVERSHEWHSRIRHLSRDLAQNLRLFIDPC